MPTKNVNMVPVVSSNISAIGYDHTTKTLFIRFHTGLYRYDNVTYKIYQELEQSPSKGKFVNAFLRGMGTKVQQ